VSERVAFILVFVAIFVLMALAYLAIAVMHASENVLVLAYLVSLVGGAYASSSVVMHYGSSEHRRR
jgi:tetrahydromethanopterin S-methyltransferase subunit E